MLSFPFNRLDQYQGQSASIKRPRELTVFSFDEKHECFPLDHQSLRYYYPPFFNDPASPVPHRVDLSKGFDRFVKYDDTSVDLHLNPLLDTIRAHEEQTGSQLDADILTWRGMMTKVCFDTPLHRREHDD
jgi:RAT1-interacting protein